MRPPDEELRRLGASLREIDPSTLAPDPEGGAVRWFLGEEGTEVYVWTREGSAPHHVQLVFARVSVEWGDKRGLITGTFNASPTTAGGRYDSYILKEGVQVDSDVCEAALVLLGASKVDAAALAPLLDALRHATPAHLS
jgi:hypothetical protein